MVQTTKTPMLELWLSYSYILYYYMINIRSYKYNDIHHMRYIIHRWSYFTASVTSEVCTNDYPNSWQSHECGLILPAPYSCIPASSPAQHVRSQTCKVSPPSLFCCLFDFRDVQKGWWMLVIPLPASNFQVSGTTWWMTDRGRSKSQRSKPQGLVQRQHRPANPRAIWTGQRD